MSQTIALPVRDANSANLRPPASDTIALIGNPNAGKTSLFNAMTGLRARTANFSGTTVEHRQGTAVIGGQKLQLIDLPGLYSLDAATLDERIARDVLVGRREDVARPGTVVLIIDATNLERNLFLAGQVIDLGLPTVIALNMIDLAKQGGIDISADELARQIGCPVVPIVARSGQGVDQLKATIAQVIETQAVPTPDQSLPDCGSCAGCKYAARYDWAEQVGRSCSTGPHEAHGKTTQAIDRVLTHPVVGVAAFFAVMFAVFGLIFWIAQYPMGWIDTIFATAGVAVASVVPAGDVQSLLVEGVIGGVGGMLIFLPQICMLFFFLALLEDTGYLARAAFVMDKLMHRVGLPGKAFVPLLSAHACAIPAIMATRVIENKRDRLVTVLVAPLMTCSARVPVYVMVLALLFPDSPLMAGLLFTGAYVLGIIAAMAMALIFKGTILRGKTRPMVIELPGYKLPSLRNALYMTWDRAWIFIKNAGTLILIISVILWVAATYPKAGDSPKAVALTQQATQLAEAGDDAGAQALLHEASDVQDHYALDYSVAGRIGNFIEPVIEPLGYDGRIGIGIVSSFAAREVIVSTLAVLYGVGEDAVEDEPTSLYDTMRQARHDDGSPVFTTATCLSLLVFYVLAMQCLPTQAVTRRETNSWLWPAFQLGYMTVLAYTAALVTYQVASAMT